MSENQTQPPNDDDDNAPAIEDDPALGKYVAHYPSNRLRLLIIGGLIYTAVVLFLQVFFAGLDDAAASIVLIGSYSLLALAIGWYVLHLWNREVILYERGFTYREGSRTGQFLYAKIISLHIRAERFAFMNLIRRDVYQCTMLTDQDERLMLNNIYSNIGELVTKLETAITRARLPVIEVRMERGETVEFGTRLSLDKNGILLDDERLAWNDFAGHRIESKNLVLNGKTGVSVAVPVAALDNALLLLALLKSRA
jgi:hypothetical protein